MSPFFIFSNPFKPYFSTANDPKTLPYTTAFLMSDNFVEFLLARYPIIAPANESPAPVGSTTSSKENPAVGKITTMRFMANENQDQRILVEQVHLLYHTLFPILLANVLVSVAIVYGLWEIIPQSALTTWLGLMFILIIVRELHNFNHLGFLRGVINLDYQLLIPNIDKKNLQPK